MLISNFAFDDASDLILVPNPMFLCKGNDLGPFSDRYDLTIIIIPKNNNTIV